MNFPKPHTQTRPGLRSREITPPTSITITYNHWLFFLCRFLWILLSPAPVDIVWYSLIDRVLYIPGGAGSLPSTVALCQQTRGVPPFISFYSVWRAYVRSATNFVAVGSSIGFCTSSLNDLESAWTVCSMLVLYVFLLKTHDKFRDMFLTYVWCRILPNDLQNDQVLKYSLCWKHRNLSPSFDYAIA